jgi:hypothetical protein
MLAARYSAINQHISDGVNKHIKVIGAAEKRRWKLLYPSSDESVNSDFYSQLPGIGIADLLWFVAGNTGFLNAFTHVFSKLRSRISPRRLKNTARASALRASPLFSPACTRRRSSTLCSRRLPLAQQRQDRRGQVQAATAAATGLACFIFRFLRRPLVCCG